MRPTREMGIPTPGEAGGWGSQRRYFFSNRPPRLKMAGTNPPFFGVAMSLRSSFHLREAYPKGEHRLLGEFWRWGPWPTSYSNPPNPGVLQHTGHQSPRYSGWVPIGRTPLQTSRRLSPVVPNFRLQVHHRQVARVHSAYQCVGQSFAENTLGKCGLVLWTMSVRW